MRDLRGLRDLEGLVLGVALLLALSGCIAPARTTPVPTPTSTTAPSPTVAATTAPSATVTEPVAVAPTATLTAAPTVEATQPVIEAENLGVYTAALRPEAAANVDLSGLTSYRLKVFVATDLTEFGGFADIRYTNREDVPLEEIYVHLYPNLWAPVMRLGRVDVDGQWVQTYWSTGEPVAAIPLASPLAPGASVDLRINFEVKVPEEGVGNYDELAFKEGVLALTHFYPTVAVYDAADGGWQIERPAPQGDVIYHDASLYEVWLTTDSDVQVAATGVELDREKFHDGTTIWHFGGGPMRDFTAALSRDYKTATKTVDGVTYTSYYLPGAEVNGERVLDIAAAAVETFEAEFGPYPYRELDIAATGTTAAGIEYPGLVVLAAGLYDRGPDDTGFEAVTAHETAHQWWYGVVGNDQLDDPWLDESLAQYSVYRYFLDQHGERGGESFRAALEERWNRVDRIEKPVGLPVSEYSDSEYSGLVYGRGALFWLALRDRLGEERMAEFLRRYYREQTWSLARPAELQTLAETVAGQSLDDLFSAWVYPQP